MPDIRRLDQSTVDRIAAGEVVERPAAAVKELVENSLDAGASAIDVEIEAGGTELVRVRDDGCGMTEEELRVAVEKHTTSKIERLADLEHVGTLGFRGEALHAIAAVSKTTVTSRAADAARGAELTIEGGEAGAVRPAGRPVGTTVTVRELFYNVPARRKYLAGESTEFARCNRVVSRYALANPEVAVSLTHDGRETFATPGRGDLREAALAVYGREVAESLVPIEADAAALADAPLEAVRGYVGDPETTRSTREYLATYVNGRYVDEPVLREAVLAGYGGQLAPDRFPFAVLFVECPPGAVDANVHPRKLEVRFSDEAGVRTAAERTVRDGLLDAGLIRSGAPRGRSAPGDAAVEPERVGDATALDRSDSDRSDSDRPDCSDSDGDRADAGPASDRAADADPVRDSAADADTPNAGTTASTALDDAPSPPVSGEEPSNDPPGDTPSVSGGDFGDCGGESGKTGPDETAGNAAVGSLDATTVETDGEDAPADATSPADEDAPAGRRDARRSIRPATRNATLPGFGGEGAEGESGSVGATGADAATAAAGELPSEGAATASSFDRLPSLRLLGQLDETYVVAATAGGLVLIDQHAADERVHYERLAAAAAERGAAQRLVEPVELELTAGEAAVFDDALEELATLGFEADLDGRTATVAAVPAVLAEALSPEGLRDAFAEFLADEAAGTGAVEAAADALLADLSCHPAVTGHTGLSEGSIVALLEALDDCENPYACPHGRPTIVEIGAPEIADRFERDYPGHATRRPEG